MEAAAHRAQGSAVRWLLPIAPLAVLLSLLLLQPTRARESPFRCVTLDIVLTSRFQLIGPGWIGGDGAQSISVGKSRLWIFGDSFLGNVETDGSHSHPGCRIVRSTALRETAAGLRIVNADLQSLISGTDESRRWHWLTDGVYEAGEVRMPVWSVQWADGPFPFQVTGLAVARLSWPGLDLIDLIPKPYRGILWGLSLYRETEWTYIYGWNAYDKLYVARARTGALAGRWMYRTRQSTWSSRQARAAPILTNASTGSVVPYRGKFVLITQRPRFGANIALHLGETPYGPFDRGRTIYRTPESSSRVFTYAATAHSRVGDELRVGYSVNAWSTADLHEDASIYRPRFIRVDLGCVLDD